MSIRHERGAALLVSLIVLVLITILAVTGVRMSIGGLRGAVNEELRVDAFHRAQSLVDGTLSVPVNTTVVGLVGEVNCMHGMLDGCDRNELVLPSMSTGDFVDSDAMEQAYEDLVNSGVEVSVRRLAPDQTPPPRTVDYSAVKFQAAVMEVNTSFDQTDVGYGRASIDEGVVVIVPNLSN